MNSEEARLLRIVLILMPLGIWIALSAAAQWRSSSLLSFVPWIKRLRWTAYICGLALCLAHFTSAHFSDDFDYGSAVLTLSVGLSIPESWLKKRAGGPGAGGEKRE